MTPMPFLSKVCRKVAEYLASRSTMRKRLSRSAPDLTSIKFRETCSIQTSFVLVVIPQTVARREASPMSFEKSRPGNAPAARRCGFDQVIPENSPDRAAAYADIQVDQGTLYPSVTQARIVRGHAYDELLDVDLATWPAGTAALEKGPLRRSASVKIIQCGRRPVVRASTLWLRTGRRPYEHRSMLPAAQSHLQLDSPNTTRCPRLDAAPGAHLLPTARKTRADRARTSKSRRDSHRARKSRKRLADRQKEGPEPEGASLRPWENRPGSGITAP